MLATFRKTSDPEPSKAWPITKNCGIAPVREGKFRLRGDGTSTLFAVARGAYEVDDMVREWGGGLVMVGTAGGAARRWWLRRRLAETRAQVRSEKLGEVADEFDSVHSVHRALRVGSLDRIVPASGLRPYLVDAVERGMARETGRAGPPVAGSV